MYCDQDQNKMIALKTIVNGVNDDMLKQLFLMCKKHNCLKNFVRFLRTKKMASFF